MNKRTMVLFGLTLLWCVSAAAQNKRDDAVRKDKATLENDGSWIYGDFDKALATAKAADKPLLVVFR